MRHAHFYRNHIVTNALSTCMVTVCDHTIYTMRFMGMYIDYDNIDKDILAYTMTYVNMHRSVHMYNVCIVTHAYLFEWYNTCLVPWLYVEKSNGSQLRNVYAFQSLHDVRQWVRLSLE